MSDSIRDARKRIDEIRRRDVEIAVTHEGKPVEGAEVNISMRRHEFLFGASCFNALKYEDEGMRSRYEKLFGGIMNYATLPFYWGNYEPEQYKYNEPYISNLVDWTKRNGFKSKGHPLVWHASNPGWLNDSHNVEELVRERVTDIFVKYGNMVDFWDLCNETTVNFLMQNPVSAWIDKVGPMNMMRLVADAARAVTPDAKFLYNDYNVRSDDFLRYLAQMREENIDIYGVGIQSHMHSSRWEFDDLMYHMDRTAEFGWPLHFTECTVISGTCANPDGKIDWWGPNLWSEPEEMLYDQAEYTRDFYTMVYSHPATEALTWWNLPDHSWLRAPGGLVTDTMYQKPVYYELEKLIWGEWATRADLATGTGGNCKLKAFCGVYDIAVKKGEVRHSTTAEIFRSDKPFRLEITI